MQHSTDSISIGVVSVMMLFSAQGSAGYEHVVKRKILVLNSSSYVRILACVHYCCDIEYNIASD